VAGEADEIPIVVTEQATGRILVLDPRPAWSSPAAVQWSWRPPPSPHRAGSAGSWGLPDDVRLRVDPVTGQRSVLVCDSYGLVAVVPYPAGGAPAWSVEVGRAANPHGIERLPDGNVAAAASTGGWVRLYRASKGPECTEYVEDLLPGAHQVLYRGGALWAVGDHLLVRYEIGGKRGASTLRRRDAYPLPTFGGHDLQPVPHQAGTLWVTTESAVYQFDMATGRFHRDYVRGPELDRSDVKSVGTSHRTGTVLQTRADPNNGHGWSTDRVDLYIGANDRVSKTLPGASIYRARWFDQRCT
jgi:hypothetical protein